MNKKIYGFTLIEMMIVVSIIGILASIAIPNYMDYIRKTRRVDAQGVLLQNSQILERLYTTNNKYTEGGACSTSIIDSSPIDGSTKYYDISLLDCTDSTYTLRATPKDSQLNNGILELRHTGRKGWDQDNNGTIDYANNLENHW